MRRMLAIVVAAAGLACAGPGGGPPESVRAFGASDTPIAASGVTVDDGGWRIERSEPDSLPLFEVGGQRLRQTVLTYRARMKSRDVTGQAYLEMWVRVPGRGEFFSRGLAQPLRGTTDWASYEIPFLLNEADVEVDLVKLNVAFAGGGGTVWVRDVELLKSPL